MRMMLEAKEERDFFGPRRPTWTDFERLWYLRDLAESSGERLESLERDPNSKEDAKLYEEISLRSTKKALKKLSDIISFF